MATSTAYRAPVATVKTRPTKLKAPAAAPDRTRFLEGQKILDWLEDKTTLDARPVMMTPPIAEVLLKRNTKNRPIVRPKMGMYAQDMEDGKFPVTSCAISYDWDGRLQNGQHRLAACIASGATFYTILVKGLDPASFLMEDTQIKRTLSDLLCIEGEKNYPYLAGALSYLSLYVGTVRALAGQTLRPRYPGLTRDEVKLSTLRVNAARMANWERWTILQENPSLRDSVAIYAAGHTSYFINRNMLATTHFLGARVNEATTKVFLEKLVTSIGIMEEEPVGRLLNVLKMDSAKPVGKRLRTNQKFQFMLKALRLTLEKKPCKVLQIEFPERRDGKIFAGEPITILEDLVPESMRIK